MNSKTRLFIGQTSLVRKLGVSPATFRRRLNAARVQPDALVVNGNKHGLLFDIDRLAEIRKSVVEVIA